jgi:cyclopropane fatty-acyl-phospholipid synthase-like methyltransferase
MGADHDRETLLAVYANHPLREETIVARVLRQRGSLDGMTAIDLAHDTVTEITDQNHVGGIASVVQLAIAAGITPRSRVVDIGSGLGGSARCLACLYGCRVEGVELSPQRCEEGRRLTARVHLDHLVTFTCGDILEVGLAARAFDVVWGQGAWMHIADLPGLFRCAAMALAPEGCVAFEEAMLSRAARDKEEAATIAELERLWNGRLLPADAWRSALRTAALEVTSIDNLTGPFVESFQRLEKIAQREGAGQYNPHEMRAYACALTLARAGAISYARIIARPRASG